MVSSIQDPTNVNLTTSQDSDYVVIVEKDKKRILFICMNGALNSWENLKCVQPESFKRNNKGTLNKGIIHSSNLETLNLSKKTSPSTASTMKHIPRKKLTPIWLSYILTSEG